jgi:L-asparaginase
MGPPLISSNAIGPSHWLEINDLIHRVVEEHRSISGVVLTHGTATLEETAYFLNLTLKVTVPVVVVGAHRPVSALSSDGPMNLLNAARLAAATQSRGLGVLTLLNDEVQAAREVSKTSTYRLDSFSAPELGMLGFVDPDGSISIYRSPLRRRAPNTEFDVRGLYALPQIAIVHSYAGAGRETIDAAISAGAAGIVVAALAPGWVTPQQEVALNDAARRGVLIVLSTRAGAGRVLERTTDLEAGYVAADNLNPQKARVLAMLALAQTKDRDAIRRMFHEY